MTNKLSSGEIAAIYSKLQADYEEMSKEAPSIFQVNGVKQRYYQTVAIRGDLQKFLKDEVLFFEELKKRHKSKLERREASKGETLNRLMEESIARLQKYQKIDFHPISRPEIRYFYGAIVDFTECELVGFSKIFKGTPEFFEFQEIVGAFERMGITRRGIQSIRITEHTKALLDANGSQAIIEAESQKILKEYCLHLRDFHVKIKTCLEKNLVSKTFVLKFDERLEGKAFAKYNNVQAIPFMESMLSKIKEILEDFRMKDLVGLKE